MSSGLNKVILIGYLGADPELRHTQSGQPVCRIRVATTEVYQDRAGTKQSHTEWHNVVVWGRTAEVTNRYLSKGRQVYIEGRLRTRKWQDRNGTDRYTTEVIAQRILFLGGRTEMPELPAAEGVPATEEEIMDPFASDFNSDKQSKQVTKEEPEEEDDLPF